MPQHMAIEMPRHAATFPTKNVHDEHGTRLADPEQSGDGRLHVAGSPGPARGPRLSSDAGLKVIESRTSSLPIQLDT